MLSPRKLLSPGELLNPGELRLERRLVLASATFVATAVPVAVLAYAATHGWAPLHRLDSGVADDLHDWTVRQPHAVGFLEGVSTVLHPWVLRAATVGVVAGLLVRRQRRLAMWLGTTVVAAGLLGLVLKGVVARSRPVLPDPVAHAGGYSFPSGHALNSFVILVAFVLVVLPAIPRRWHAALWGAAAGAVLLVGFARVALGVHYLSDVVGGWLIGAGLLAVTVIAFETWRRDRGLRVPHVLDEGVDPAASRATAGSTGRGTS